MKFLLIDGNAIGYAAHLAGHKLTVGTGEDEMETQAAYGITNSMRDYIVKHPFHKLVVLWDGNPQWRKDLYPEYKGNRSNDEKKRAMKAAYKEQGPFIERIIQSLGIDQMRSNTCEADDLAGALTLKLASMGHEVKLLTGDQDWLQLLREGVTWEDPIRQRTCDLPGLYEFSGYKNAQQFVEGKALTGDTSDNIKGVGQLGEKRAKALLSQYGSVDIFMRSFDFDAKNPKFLKDFYSNAKGGQDKYAVNLKIMDLRRTNPGVSDRVVTKGVYNEAAFVEVCEELCFLSILSNLGDFTAPFEARA